MSNEETVPTLTIHYIKTSHNQTNVKRRDSTNPNHTLCKNITQSDERQVKRQYQPYPYTM